MNALGNPATNRVASRIETDVETIKEMIGRIDSSADRIVRHARALGYFEPPKDAVPTPSTPTPVITTLADALQALGRAIDHCSGSLNVFD